MLSIANQEMRNCFGSSFAYGTSRFIILLHSSYRSKRIFLGSVKVIVLSKQAKPSVAIINVDEYFQKQVYMYPQKLKLGILLDSLDVPAWVENSIRRVIDENAGEIVLVIMNNGLDRSLKFNGSTIVYSIFNWIDEKLFTKEPNPFAPKCVAELLINVPVINATPIKKNDNWFLSEADAQNIKEYRLDILIKFGFEHLCLETLNVSKYGTWFYYHGDDRVMRGGPPGFWEVVENWTETSSGLIAVGGKSFPSRVLFRSHFMTYPLSPARHRSYYFWVTTSFLPRQINLLQRLGEKKYFLEPAKFNKAPLRTIKKYAPPSNFLATIAIAKIIVRQIKEIWRRALYTDQWFLLFSLNKHGFSSFNEFNKIMPPRGEFWADPHVIHVNGKYYIFIEEFLNAKNKGCISVIELDGLGNWKAPMKVLEQDYHLSYPFVFQWEHKFYMVPESRENKTIDIYECAEFPYKWSFKQSLMKNVSAVDSTIIYYSNKWWLFTAMAENEAAVPNFELFLFYAESLFGDEWKAHPQNPIISDVKKARPARSFFMKDGKLFRPSQDCSKAYGYGFDLNEVEVLSDTEYRERRISSVRPNWDKKILATHTFASCGNLTVIDVFRQTLKI